ncbi:MAG TPA: rhomboid family intramembrane serine protease [Blastocatellia bacterium]|nr:rhomboid family intramembrane serine protease [Blastocatellia bacterium]
MFGERKKLVMCQACRALVEASANPCPLCGKESVPARRVRTSATAESSSFISFIILTINILLFVLMAVVEVKSGRGAEAFVQSPSIGVLIDFGGLDIQSVAEGQWWRLVTYNFLHIGLMHLLFNSSALYQVGPQVEELYGSQKFIFIYMLTGVTSAVASFFFNLGGAGASGAIFGLIGLMAVYGYRLGGSYGQAIMRQMLIWGAIGFLFGFVVPNINNVAHAGGFIAGGCLGFVISPDAPATSRASLSWNAAAIACILVLASSFALAGKSYGEIQEREVQKNYVLRLSDLIRDGQKAWNQSITALDSKQDLPKIAESLKGVATNIDNIPQIDERSTEIRKRIVESFNKRASAVESAGKDEKALALTSIADFEEAKKAFDDYFTWEGSVLKKYGLVRGKK